MVWGSARKKYLPDARLFPVDIRYNNTVFMLYHERNLRTMKNEKILGEFFKYSSLNVMGMIGLSCYILADTFFVSKGLGADGLAALNLARPVYSFINGSGLMIGMGGGIKYSILGSRNSSKASNVFTDTVYLAALFAVMFITVGLFFKESIISLFGADGNVFDMSVTYLKVLLMYSPAFIMNNVLLCFVRNDGSPQLSMTAMIAGSLSNVVLDWVFIFPCGMGIFGAAFATGLAPIISMIILSVYFIKKRNGFRLAKTAPDLKTIAAILSGGVPSLVTEVSSGVVMIVFNSIIMRLEGNIGVAAYGIIANISLVIISIYTGVAQGIQPILSKSCGERNYHDMRSVFGYAVLAVIFVSVVVYAAVFFFAGPIAGIFNSEGNAELQRIAEQGLKLYFIACPFAGLNVIVSAYFTSTEYPLPAHIISVLRGFAVIIPAAFFLSAVVGMVGVWSAFPATEVVVCAVGVVFYMICSGKQRNVFLRI